MSWLRLTWLGTLCNRVIQAAICAAVIQTSGDAAIIAGLNADRHDRFLSDDSPNPGFFVDESQLTGLALKRGALISPRHYVTATHITSENVTFRGSDGVLRTYNSIDSLSLTTLVEGEPPTASDIRVHRLDQEVDSSITPLPVVVGDLDALVGNELIAFDRNVRAGRNLIDAVGVVEFESGNGDTVAIQYSFDTDTNGGSGGFDPDEIGLLTGDSGNIALIDINGQIGLIGAHMGIDVPEGNDPNQGDFYNSFSTVVGAYQSELISILAADGYTLQTIAITAIPEPGPVAFLIAGYLVFFARRRRQATTGVASANMAAKLGSGMAVTASE